MCIATLVRHPAVRVDANPRARSMSSVIVATGAQGSDTQEPGGED